MHDEVRRFFESTGNWLKCPEEPRINLPRIAERESVCVRGRKRPVVTILQLELLCIYLGNLSGLRGSKLASLT